ncbi:hypothetical protein [Methanothrix soehngenii]|uniref:hypothetical protein n=1 Tax=Methanothrix soehngenii TaxID=2223 RepID=UPI00300C4462
MTEMQLSLINFPYREMLSNIFQDYSNDFEFTASGIFRKIVPPLCPECGHPMSHNGFNTCQKSISEGQTSGNIYVALAESQLKKIETSGSI